MGSLSVLPLQLLSKGQVIAALQQGCQAFLEALKEREEEEEEEET